MAVAHAKYKPLLKDKPGLSFLDAVNVLQMPWSANRTCLPNAYYYQVFEEFPLPHGLINVDVDKAGAKQCDAMIHMNYRRGALFYEDGVQIMVEIKQTRHDLLRAIREDDYFFKYLGLSDFLYLATSPELLNCAEKFVQDIPKVGLFDIMSGKIYKLAERQEVPKSQKMINYQTMLCYYKEMPSFVNTWFPAVSIGLSQNQPFSMIGESVRDKNIAYFKACYEARHILCQSIRDVPLKSKLKQYYLCLKELQEAPEPALFQ